MTLDWLQARFQGHSDMGLWLSLSLLLYFFSAILSWLIDRVLTGVRGLGPRQWRSWAGWPWLLDILRWTYMIGLPFLLLVSGLLSPAQIGLSELDWVGAVRRGGVVSVAALLLLLIAWRSFLRAWENGPIEGKYVREPLTIACVVSLAEVTALQLHWDFYRIAAAALPWEVDTYWTAWLGAALILVQWGLNPWVWRSLRSPGAAERALRRWVMLIVSTALFLVARNLWLPWLVHVAFECYAGRTNAHLQTDGVRANGEGK